MITQSFSEKTQVGCLKRDESPYPAVLFGDLNDERRSTAKEAKC